MTVTADPRPRPIPWRRLAGLLRALWRGTAAMVALSVVGVLVELVPPLVLGVLVNALVERNDRREAALLAVVVALAIVCEAALYIASDGIYARNASRLSRNLRLGMLEGALARVRRGEDTGGVSSRFISDAETLERASLSILDTGSMLSVEFVSALVALGILEPWTLPVVAPVLAGTWIATRRMQEPAAFAGNHHAGTLISIYLLARRAFWGFDGVVDLSLGTQSVRGAVARCFELVDEARP